MNTINTMWLPKGLLIEYPTLTGEISPVFISFIKITHVDVIGVNTVIHLDGKNNTFTVPYTPKDFEKLIIQINK